MTRLAAGLASASENSVLESGDADREISLPLAFRKGELVRPTIGGVLVRETGGVGLLIEGLSQEEKKSSLESLAGVAEPSASAGTSVTTTSSGYLIHASVPSTTIGVFKVIDLLESVPRSAFLEFFLILGSGVGLVFRLGIFACKSSTPTVCAEVLGGGFITTNFHNT